MSTVSTATGPVDPGDLGPTLMHEHLFIRSPGVFEAWPHLWDPAAERDHAIASLTALAAAGVRTLVDLTTIDLGRDVGMVRDVASAVDVNIVMATGVWRAPPLYFTHLSPNRIADLFVRDVIEGMAGTECRAGIIKLATEPSVDELNERLLTAGARACVRTGVPISTHSFAEARSGLAQQDIFEREGVDLARVVIGHSGDSVDLDYLTALMDRGSSIGMDRFGLPQFRPDDQRIDTVARLCAAGYAGQMVLSHDANCFMDTIPRAYQDQHLPDWHFLHLSRTILPALRERGVSEVDITAMMVDNPRRILSRIGL
jgi:phosphotriesterase-related protein